jgi:hypothetical protein
VSLDRFPASTPDHDEIDAALEGVAERAVAQLVDDTEARLRTYRSLLQ